MDPSVLNQLYHSFTDPNSRNFANVNVEQFFQNSKSDALKHPVSRDDIKYFQSSLESLSRQKERRLLGGRKRKASYRKWIVFAPRHIILGGFFFFFRDNITHPAL